MPSIDLKPLVAVPVVNSARDDFKSGIGKSPVKRTYKKKASLLGEGAADWKKILVYGNTGSGKTYALGQLALAGYKCAGISTDFGGNGLSSAFALINAKDSSKINNIYNVDLDSYEEVMDFLEEPTTFFPDLYDYNPDFLYWEGFSAYQQTVLSDKISEEMQLAEAAKENNSGADASGLRFFQSEWGKIRSGTLRPLNRFLNLHNKANGKHWHKFVSCHKDRPKEDKLTSEKTRGPLIQGAAYSFIPAAFDLVIEIKVSKSKAGDDESNSRYSYLTQGDEGIVAKTRGLNLLPSEPADMVAMWKKIEAQMHVKKEG